MAGYVYAAVAFAVLWLLCGAAGYLVFRAAQRLNARRSADAADPGL